MPVVSVGVALVEVDVFEGEARGVASQQVVRCVAPAERGQPVVPDQSKRQAA